jgi:hypothetical protein
MNEFLKYNFVELIKLRDTVKQKHSEAETYTKLLKERLTSLNKIIKQNEEGHQNWIVFLPHAMTKGMSVLEVLEKTKTDKPKWKNIALEVFETFNIPMTSDLMYSKAAQIFEDLPTDKANSIKALSTALIYLFQKGDVFREKVNGSREFIYAKKEHFDFNGKLKLESFQTFKLELEGM